MEKGEDNNSWLDISVQMKKMKTSENVFQAQNLLFIESSRLMSELCSSNLRVRCIIPVGGANDRNFPVQSICGELFRKFAS